MSGVQPVEGAADGNVLPLHGVSFAARIYSRCKRASHEHLVISNKVWQCEPGFARQRAIITLPPLLNYAARHPNET